MRSRRKLKRKAPFIICCLVLLALLVSGCVLARNILFSTAESGEIPIIEPTLNKRLNVLLLGIDARQGETMARADTMILASIDPKSKQMALLSIPRDTRVNIPGYGWDKINSTSVYGGPELSMTVASNLLGIPIKHYVLTNFSGFKDIVDALGGVTLEVDRDMYHWDNEDGGIYEINLKKGVQRLDGEKALQFVRYREYFMGDIDRTKQQQKFLVALVKEILQPGTIVKLPRLIPEINRYVTTNLNLSDLYTLASAARNLGSHNIVSQTLPGRPIDVNGGSYWGVDPAEARQMVAQLFNGEVPTNVVLTTPLKGLPVQPKTEDTSPQQTDKDEDKQDRTGTETTAKPGTGSSGSVKITPVTPESESDSESDPDSDAESETTTTKPPAGTKPGSSTGSGTNKTPANTVNPAIPGGKT